MSADGVECPACGSERVRYREHRDDWFCDDCDHRWTVNADDAAAMEPKKPLLFLSYARRDASELAVRLKSDLEAHGYRVWLDRPEIVAGREWEHQISDGLRSAQRLVAVLTPSAVRRSTDPTTPDTIDSVCLDEISFARFAQPPTTVVPVMAQICEPPFSIFRLDYVDMCTWRDSDERYQAGLQLLQGIKAALAGKVIYRTEISDLQPWDFAAFLYEKRRDFCGREWLLREIDLWLKTNREPALLITCDPGTGKSAVVAELVHRNPAGHVPAYHCCQTDVLSTIEPARFVRSIAAMVASQLAEYATRLGDGPVKAALDWEECSTDPFSAFEGGILTPLQALPAPSNEARYLLIDGLDEALGRNGYGRRATIVDLLSRFIERFPSWLPRRRGLAGFNRYEAA
jgi:TIR domain